MDDDMKKKVSIGVAIGCIALAIGITVITNSGGGGGGGSTGPIQMLCVNPDCNYEFEVSRDEFQKMMQEQAGDGGMMMMEMQTPAFVCPECGKKSAYVAQKCEKCGKVFVPNYQDHENFDRCPECGYSKYEEQSKK